MIKNNPTRTLQNQGRQLANSSQLHYLPRVHISESTTLNYFKIINSLHEEKKIISGQNQVNKMIKNVEKFFYINIKLHNILFNS